MLSTKTQLKVLSLIWGEQDGYIFMPWVDSSQRFHPGHAIKWPEEKDRVAKQLERHTDEDLYFTPGVFSGMDRRSEDLLPERTLWADIDESDPRDWPDGVPPCSVLWETSPGRYQGVWLLDDTVEGASQGGGLNHRVTAWVGADPSGFDSTQLLRVPGRDNHKPKFKGNPAPGRLLVAKSSRVYSADQFEGAPHIVYTDYDRDAECHPERVDRDEAIARLKPHVSRGVRELLRALAFDGDRSTRLWRIITEFAEAGATLDELVAIAEPLGWNKHRTRKELVRECLKAMAKVELDYAKQDFHGEDVQLAPKDQDDDDEEDESEEWGLRWIRKPRPRPRWLIKDIWSAGACGFIAGEPKSYKSWLGLDMALSVATGTKFLGQYAAKSGRVLYLQEEDSAELIQQRVEWIMEGKDHHPYGEVTLGDDGNVYWEGDSRDPAIRFRVHKGWTASVEEHQKWLEEQITKDKIDFVLIDTLGTTAGDVDTDKAADLLPKLLNPLRKVAQRTGAAIAIVHHNRKRSQGTGAAQAQSGQDMLGSTSLHAWVDCALYAAQVETGVVRVRRESKLGMAKIIKVRVPIMGEQSDGSFTYWSPDVTEGDDDEQDEAPQAPVNRGSEAGRSLAHRLQGVFGGHPFTREDAVTTLGIGERRFASQLQAALESGYVTATPDGTYAVCKRE